MKTKVRYNGHTLTMKEADFTMQGAHELFAVDYWKMCIDLYEKLTYCNKTVIKVKGGMDGTVKLTTSHTHDA